MTNNVWLSQTPDRKIYIVNYVNFDIMAQGYIRKITGNPKSTAHGGFEGVFEVTKGGRTGEEIPFYTEPGFNVKLGQPANLNLRKFKIVDKEKYGRVKLSSYRGKIYQLEKQ